MVPPLWKSPLGWSCVALMAMMIANASAPVEMPAVAIVHPSMRPWDRGGVAIGCAGGDRGGGEASPTACACGSGAEPAGAGAFGEGFGAAVVGSAGAAGVLGVGPPAPGAAWAAACAAACFS